MNNNYNNEKTPVYKATSNLNTSIESPQINVDSPTSVNISGQGDVNYMNGYNSNDVQMVDNNVVSNANTVNNSYLNFNNSIAESSSYVNSGDSDSSFLNKKSNNDSSNYSYEPVMENNNYSYEPVMENSREKKNNLTSNVLHSKELKMLFFIVFLLVLFVLVMPYIYDFFRGLQMGMTG